MLGDIVQPTHLLLILVVALIVLGPKRLPEVGRSLGRGLRDFRQGMQGVQDEARGMFNDVLEEPSEPFEDSAVSTVPEPLNPPTAEPLVTSTQVAESVAAPVAAPASTPAVTKVVPAEPDPAEFAD
jgi:sec-independent protein translocase protein TatA